MNSNSTQHTPITKRLLLESLPSKKKEVFETISTQLNSIAKLTLRCGHRKGLYLHILKHSLNDAESQLFEEQLQKLKGLGLAIFQEQSVKNALKTSIDSESTNLQLPTKLDSSDLFVTSSIENEDGSDADENSVSDLGSDSGSEGSADTSELQSNNSDSDTQQRITSHFLLQCAQFYKNKPGVTLCMLGVALLAIALGATCLLGAGVAHSATVLGYAGGAMMLGGAAVLFFNSPKPVGSEPAQIQTSEPGPSV